MPPSIGESSLEDLSVAAVPDSIKVFDGLELDALTEAEVLAALRDLADHNEVLVSMIGLGYHDTITPPVLRRNVLATPAWYTAYTPSPPEHSPGRLEALLTYTPIYAAVPGV